MQNIGGVACRRSEAHVTVDCNRAVLKVLGMPTSAISR